MSDPATPGPSGKARLRPRAARLYRQEAFHRTTESDVKSKRVTPKGTVSPR